MDDYSNVVFNYAIFCSSSGYWIKLHFTNCYSIAMYGINDAIDYPYQTKHIDTQKGTTNLEANGKTHK